MRAADAGSVEGVRVKFLAATCILLATLCAYAFWQEEEARDEMEILKTDLLEAGVEIERLDAKLTTYREIMHAIRDGRMD